MEAKAEIKKNKKFTQSMLIEMIALIFSVYMLIAAFIAAIYTGTYGTVFSGWFKIMTGPNPLITDYYEVGGLAATFLNAGMCGMFCVIMMMLMKGDSRPNALAGYFLVVAHCFYGLNFLNMMPCFFAPFLYFKIKKLDFNDNLHVNMFATCFGPFISEFLFRYTLGDAFVPGEIHITGMAILTTAAFAVMLGFVIPAILPGAHAWHKGFNLYNGGLAFGMFGFFLFNLFYKVFGVAAPVRLEYYNAAYEAAGHCYRLFINTYFICVLLTIGFIGFVLNGCRFKGYDELLKDTGYRSNFADRYGMPVSMINICIYGLFFLGYINIVILIAKGAGFTGPTTGIIFASMTFSLLGQHPRNVWPILAGFLILYLLQLVARAMTGLDPAWSISGQGYINSAAFATGICPIVGKFGRRAGVAGGMIDASLCSATSALHGGLVLYNGGLVSGLTVLILLPILEHYVPQHRESIRPVSMDNFIVVEEKKKSN